jgi:hypothetical protein
VKGECIWRSRAGAITLGNEESVERDRVLFVAFHRGALTKSQQPKACISLAAASSANDRVPDAPQRAVSGRGGGESFNV